MVSLSVLIPVGAATEDDPRRQRALEWLTERYRLLLPAAELVRGYHRGGGPFNRAAARNLAFDRSAGEALLIADADTVFHAEQIASGLALLEQGAPWVICYALERYYSLNAGSTDAVLGLDPASPIAEPVDPSSWDLKLTSWSGLLLVPRAAWEAVGGYDESFIGWGYEDNAFRVVLDRRVGPHQRTDDYVLHLHHDRPEGDFAQPFNALNEARFRCYLNGLLP